MTSLINTKDNLIERQTWIDSLKGIALCGVIMIHSGGSNLPSIMGKIGDVGKNGVQLFFLLSAYLSFSSYAKLAEKDNTCHKDIIKWIVKKFIRLIPIYYLAIFVYMVFTGGNTYWLGSEEHITVWNMLAHLFFLHEFFPHYVDSIIGVEWYIGTLAIFYVLMPLIYRWFDSLEKAIASWAVLSIVCWRLSSICYHYTSGLTDGYIYGAYFGSFWIVAQFPVMLMGVIFYYIIKSNILDRIKNKKPFAYITLGFSICMIGGMVLQNNSILGLSAFSLWAIWFLMLSISQYLEPCIILDNSIFRCIGRNSYPIYLFHFLFIYLYEKFVPVIANSFVINWGLKYISIIICSLILALPLNKFADKPIAALLNKTLDKCLNK